MFKPGDKVVYPHHGAAIIEKKEKRKAFGKTTEYLVLRMAHGELTPVSYTHLTLPTKA